MTTAAPISAYEATTLAFGDNGRLPCLYVIVDPRQRTDVAGFLAEWTGCCDDVEVGWYCVTEPASAHVAIGLGHRCRPRVESRMRLVFDVERDHAALDQLAVSETLVVATKPYGTVANSIAAYGVDGNTVREAIAAALSSLREAPQPTR